MQRMVSSVFVILFLGLFAKPASACGAQEKYDVYFNKGTEFFRVNLTEQEPIATFMLGGIEGTVYKTSAQGVKLIYKGRIQMGKLYAIDRCLDSPTYVQWDDYTLNPGSIGGEKLSQEFDEFMRTPRPQLKYNHKGLTVTINSDAAILMQRFGVRVTERPSGLFWTYKRTESNLSGEKNENVFVVVSVRKYPEGQYLTLSLTETDGNKRVYQFEHDLNIFMEVEGK